MPEEQLQEEVIEVPGATKTGAEAEEEQPGASPEEKEAERVAREEAEADQIVDSFTPEQQKKFNRALGIKLGKREEREARLRRDVQREADERAAAMARDLSPRESKQVSTEPETDPDDPEPELPDFVKALTEWTGPLEDFNKWQREQVKKFKADLPAWNARQQDNRAFSSMLDEQLKEQNKRLESLPEVKEMQRISREAKLSEGLLDYVGNTLAPLKNGHEVIKEVLLDPDLLDQLQQLDKVKDGDGIKAFLYAVSHDLRKLARRSADDADLQADGLSQGKPDSTPPKPITPVKKSGHVARDDESLSPEEYQLKRLKQLAKK